MTWETARRIIASGVTVELTGDGYHRDRYGWEHHRFAITVNGQECPTTWRQGLGIDRDPDPAEVLSSLVRDSAETEEGFQVWADSYGYDSDSLSAWRTFEQCVAIGEWLTDIIGADAVSALIDAGDES